MKKECSKCQEVKELSDFPKDSTRQDGYGYMCKTCKNRIKKAYRDNNKDKIKEENKANYLKRKNGNV